MMDGGCRPQRDSHAHFQMTAHAYIPVSHVYILKKKMRRMAFNLAALDW